LRAPESPAAWEANRAALAKSNPALLDALLRLGGGGEGESAGKDRGASGCAGSAEVGAEGGGESRGAQPQAEASASGAPTLLASGVYAHSRRDPEREGQRLAQACLREAGGGGAAALVMGFGLGYAAEALARLAPQMPLVIAEKDLGMLRLAFSLRDLSAFLSRPRVAFAPGGGGEGAVAALSFFEKSAAETGSGAGAARTKKRLPIILRGRAMSGGDAQWRSDVEGRVRAWASQGDVNRATLGKFGRRWMRNLARNMPALRDLPGISGLSGLAALPEPIPVFLAAAGPSLDGIGALLHEIRRRCIVVAVDTSLRFFHRRGAEPDFALVADPQFWNCRHLDCMLRLPPPGASAASAGAANASAANTDAANAGTAGANADSGAAGARPWRTRLVAESAAYPPVLRLPFAGSFLCGSLFPLGAFVEGRVDPKGLLGAGGSVATSAWDFCRHLGAREIWAAGLDLAFPGGRTHFRGALFGEKALAESCRLRPAETTLHAALRGGAPYFAPSASGGRALTDRRLSLYAAWFESSLRAAPGIRSLRLMAGGAGEGLAISGFESAPPEAILALPDRRAEIDACLQSAFAGIEAGFRAEGEALKRGRRYCEALAALRAALEKTSALCAEGERLARRALRACRASGAAMADGAANEAGGAGQFGGANQAGGAAATGTGAADEEGGEGDGQFGGANQAGGAAATGTGAADEEGGANKACGAELAALGEISRTIEQSEAREIARFLLAEKTLGADPSTGFDGSPADLEAFAEQCRALAQATKEIATMAEGASCARPFR